MMGFGFGGTFGSLLWGLSMLLSMLLPIAVIVGAAYLVINLLERRKTASVGETGLPDPLTILKSRYAKGEISKEEYYSMKEDLVRG